MCVAAEARREPRGKAVAEILVDLDLVRELDAAGLVGDFDVPLGAHRLLVLVVGQPVGSQRAPSDPDFDIALSRHDQVVAVLSDEVGAQEHVL